MALVLVKEDGTGKADANSYAAAADGDAYHEGHLYASAWTVASAGNKEAALVMASRVIDAQVTFKGLRSSITQALQWPRSGCVDPDLGEEISSSTVPKALVEATCEMARELLMLDRTGAPPGEGIIAQWTEVSGTKYSKFDQRPVLPRFVQSMLAKLGTVAARSGAVGLQRS
jgi:hypothetical protein